MRYRLPLIVLALSVALPAPASSRGTTGEPSFEEFFTPTRLSIREKYEETHRWGAPGRNPIEVKVFPDDDSDAARYGMLNLDKHALTYRVEPREDGTLHVVLDGNADGDLTNDPALELTGGTGPWGKEIWTFALDEVKVALVADASMAYVYQTQTRAGSIRIDDRSVRFVLQGTRGVYDQPEHRVYLDVDGDGEVAVGDLGSPGAYEVNDQYLWLDGQRYRFSVERDGSALTLYDAPTDDAPPPPVHTGADAASFGFVDMEGRPGTLREYRGNVVLIYFWGSWCGPCIHTLPDLAQTYREYRAHGLRVLGVAKSSAPDDVRAIMAEHDLDWRHVLEDSSNPIASLYRVRGVPEYILVDARGKIAGRGRGFDLKAALAALIPGESDPDFVEE